MRIAMIGTGYVGLVSGACFSEFGHDVVCVDKDAAKVASLRAGKIPIFEPGLDEVVATNMRAGRLAFDSDMAKAVASAEAVFIAVGTPSRRGDGHADLTYVFAAAEELAAHLNGYTVVVTKSTVPVGHQPQGEGDHPPCSPRCRVRRRLQSRIPARGFGDRGFPQARPRRGRLRQRPRARRDARDLSPALSARDADRVHQPRKRRS